MHALARVLPATLLPTVFVPTISIVLTLVLQAIHRMTAMVISRMMHCVKGTTVKLPTWEHHSPQH
jgi:hypothetical protein